jgi:hypothetical protein
MIRNNNVIAKYPPSAMQPHLLFILDAKLLDDISINKESVGIDIIELLSRFAMA